MTADEVKRALGEHADDNRAKHSARFFKSAPGQYGEGDEFIGVSVPDQRRVARRFKRLSFSELEELFNSSVHEHRLTGCLILVYAYQADGEKPEGRIAIYNFYRRQLEAGNINNWDLIDSSAPHIMGDYLLDKSRQTLHEYARSDYLWQQRASIMATFSFIKHDDFTDTLFIAEILLDNRHDLIHKAVGWMLREIGNRDRAVAESFLQKHYKYMPRTMLRYAIEKLPEDRRQAYLLGRV